MSASLFDTHTHLGDGQFAEDREATLQRALDAGVSRLVEIADSPAEWEASIALAKAELELGRDNGLQKVAYLILQDQQREIDQAQAWLTQHAPATTITGNRSVGTPGTKEKK